MGMSPIDYDVTLMFYFDILGVSQLHMFYVWFYVLGMDPEAHDHMRCFVLSNELSSTRVFKMFCVEQEALENMKI